MCIFVYTFIIPPEFPDVVKISTPINIIVCGGTVLLAQRALGGGGGRGTYLGGIGLDWIGYSRVCMYISLCF